MKKAVIGFWYNGTYCGESIVDLKEQGEVSSFDVENARAKVIAVAEMVDRHSLPYIPRADFKVYNMF